MGFIGVIVGVGGIDVGVSVGGMGVADGSTVSVGGMGVSVVVAGRLAEGELQLIRDMRIISPGMGKMDFNFTITSCYQEQVEHSTLFLK